MALKSIKLGGFVDENVQNLNDNFSDLELRKVNSGDLAPVASSGSYSDLTGRPVIPEKTSQLNNDSGFATTAYVDGKLTAVFHYKGSKDTIAQLPGTENQVGDVYFVSEHSSEWAWDGTKWNELGSTVDLSSYATKSEIPQKTSDLTNDSHFVSDAAYVHTDSNYTSAEKQKLAGLSNYTLPVAGASLGGVKNGGNVSVNSDGTMTAPSGVTRITFTAGTPSVWDDLAGGSKQLTIPSSGKAPVGIFRKQGDNYGAALCGVTIAGANILIESHETFDGFILLA